MNAKNIFGFTLGIATCLQASLAQDSLENTRDQLDRWVETKRIVSREKSDWRLEKSILGDTKILLSNELERLEKSIEDLQSSATAADQDREKLAAEKEQLNAAASVVENKIQILETELKALVPQLPAPLTQRIQPLIRRLPEDPAHTSLSLGERLQNIVGILSQADKFNTTLTETSESREIENGKIVEVRTLYWGLAMAYYVDASGQFAGTAHPSESGWEWPRNDAAGLEIKNLLDVYEGSGAIEFVEVPARIK